MKSTPCTIAVRGFDCDAPLTDAQLDGLIADGMRFAMQCIQHPTRHDADATRARLDTITRKGLAAMLYRYFRTSGWNAETGKSDAELATAQALGVGYDAGSVLWTDYEGDFSGAKLEDLIAFGKADASGVKAKGLSPGAYVGNGTPAALIRVLVTECGYEHLWHSGSIIPEVATQPFELVQDRAANVRIGGAIVDTDSVQHGATFLWCVADDAPALEPHPATAHPDHEITDHPAAPAPDLFTFLMLAGEAKGARRARCWREALAGGPMGKSLRGPWYASFTDATKPAGYIGAQYVASIASWATSCLITQEACDNHCERTPLRPPNNGEGFFEVYPQSKLVKPSPGVYPQVGDVCWWSTPGTNNGHVEAVLSMNQDGTWTTAGGGGGADGTQCSIRSHKSSPQGYPLDGYGRPLQGWWRAEDMPLAPSTALPRPKTPPMDLPPPVDEETRLPVPSRGRPIPAPAPEATAPVVRQPIPWATEVARAGAVIGAAIAWAKQHPWAPAITAAAVVLVGVLAFLRYFVRKRHEPKGPGPAMPTTDEYIASTLTPAVTAVQAGVIAAQARVAADSQISPQAKAAIDGAVSALDASAAALQALAPPAPAPAPPAPPPAG